MINKFVGINIRVLIIFSLVFSIFNILIKPVGVEASDPIILGQPCYFEHSYELINANRSHEDNGIGEAGASVDLGANSVKPIAYSVIKHYQTCSGTDALASITGTVHLKSSAGSGLGMEITNGQGLRVDYWHLDSYTVSEGAQVTSGQKVGVIGSTGSYTNFVHIHFEAFLNGARLTYPQSPYTSQNQWVFGQTGGPNCTVPSSGVWTISSNCTITSNATAPAEVIIENGASLTIENGASLNVDLVTKYLKVKPQGKLLIKPTGKLY